MVDEVVGDVPDLGLFEGFGIEIEYMAVRSDTLDVLPVADRVLHAVAGDYVTEAGMGRLAWSNELALHVIELKTNGPVPALDGLADAFQQDVGRVNDILAALGGRLMPTAMHPWMNPMKETVLWPHGQSPIYEAFNRIFSCQGHGWANLQSMHINLPFAGDREFGRLHAAVRLLLPLLPALAASSPVVEGRVTGSMDSRLAAYAVNARRVPSVTGQVIPEPVYTRQDYEEGLLAGIYRDLAPLDPEAVLRYEWVNARGAITRFDRNAIEIRVLDTQECAAADLAVARLVVEAVRALVEEHWSDTARQQAWDTARLRHIYDAMVVAADTALIDDRAYLDALGYPDGGRCRALELWQHLIETLPVPGGGRPPHWQLYVEQGSLARRITAACGDNPGRDTLAAVYRRLCDCLQQGELFLA